MLPSFSNHNLVYVLSCEAEHLSNFAVRNSVGCLNPPNFQNIGFIRFCRTIFRTSADAFRVKSKAVPVAPSDSLRHLSRPMVVTHWFSSLRYFILLIVGRSPKKQVGRVNAFLIVAFMADQKPPHDISKVNQPRNPMCSKMPLTANPHPALSISPRKGARPLPAISKMWNVFRDWPVFINLLPKSLKLIRFELEKILGVWNGLVRSNMLTHVVFSGPRSLTESVALAFYRPNTIQFQG